MNNDFIGLLSSPMGQGILASVAGGLAGARKGRPLNTMGAAGLAGLLAYNKATDNSYEKQVRDLQMKKYQREEDEYTRQRGIEDSLTGILSKRGQPKDLAPLAKYEESGPPVYSDQDIMDLLQTKGLPGIEMASKLRGLGPKFSLQKNEKGEMVYMPDQPGAAEPVPTGIRAYNEWLDPAVKDSRLGFELEKTKQEQPFSLARASAGATRIENYPNPIPVTRDGKTKMVQFGSKGAQIETPYAPPPSDKPPTELQSKAQTFHSQMRSASDEIAKVEKGGFRPDSMRGQLDTKMAAGATNPLASPSAQQYRQAQEQWAESFLRVKTGAAATQDEVNRNIRTFFPQPGDSATVIKQKARQRAQAESDVLSMTKGGNQESGNVIDFNDLP